MDILNNKSRPEQPFVFVDEKLTKKRSRSTVKPNDITNYNRRKRSKSKKKYSPTSTKKKYFPGEYIYDTKGQMAVIKYIGACHKGPGIWFGIQFVDGTLGKHNGTINGHTYFRGQDIRCDMIRGDKIRNKAAGPINKTNKYNHRMHHKRAKSDLSHTESMCLALSYNLDKKTYKSKQKHKRNASQPTHGNYLYHRQYAKKVKKEKYKGNKYILAMEEQTEKRKNKRIGFIKTEKQRVKKQKHERNSSKVQEILKRKELEKEQLLKLNEENKLKELQRIQAAKQKSKKVNRIRSHSNSDKNEKNVKKIKCEMHKVSIEISSTPLADAKVEFNLTPIPSDIDDSVSADDNVHINTDIHAFTGTNMHKMDEVYPENSDSVRLLQELSAIPSPIHIPILELKESILPEKYINSDTYKMNEIEQIKEIDHITEPIISAKSAREIKEVENITRPPIISAKSDENKQNEEYYFPMSCGTMKQGSQSLSTAALFKRTNSTPIMVSDDKGTDYWIKQYNKSNKKKSKNKLKKRKSKSKQKKIFKRKNSFKFGQQSKIREKKSTKRESELSIFYLRF